MASPNLAVSGQIPLLSLELMPPPCSCRRWRWLRPQFGDQLQDLGEQHPRNGDIDHLGGDIAAVADELCATMGPHVVDILKLGLSGFSNTPVRGERVGLQSVHKWDSTLPFTDRDPTVDAKARI